MADAGVLFVCMGNICRSPTAEGVLRTKLQAAGLAGRVEVASAGITGYHSGEPPDPRAVKHAAARGYDLSKQRARKVTAGDFGRFDWLLAMDQSNLDRLLEQAPAGGRARIGLLLDHAPRYAAVRWVPDPYFGAAAGFERVLDLVEDGCDGLLARLQKDLGTS